jgi:hypothetical protein
MLVRCILLGADQQKKNNNIRLQGHPAQSESPNNGKYARKNLIALIELTSCSHLADWHGDRLRKVKQESRREQHRKRSSQPKHAKE